MMRLPKTVIVVVASVRDNIFIVTLVALYSTADARAARAAIEISSKPGLKIINTPPKPTAHANHVLRPALSRKINTAAKIVNRELVNCRAYTSAIGIFARAKYVVAIAA